MKFFIALSFAHRGELKPAVDMVKKTLESHGDQYVVYAEKQLSTRHTSNKKLMLDALKEIRTSDAMIVECTHKAVGVGIELGYAISLGKPIVGLRRKGAENSSTIEGTLKKIYEYEKPESIEEILGPELETIREFQQEDANKETSETETALILESAFEEADDLLKHAHLNLPPGTEHAEFTRTHLAHTILLQKYINEMDRKPKQEPDEGDYQKVMQRLRDADIALIERRELYRPLNPEVVFDTESSIAQMRRSMGRENSRRHGRSVEG